MMFHPKHVLIKDEFQKHRMDHQSDILLRAATKFRYDDDDDADADYYIYLNALTLVDVIIISTLHQWSEPYPMTKGPLSNSFSFTIPKPSLKFLLFVTKLFSAEILS